jgi:hypothetical protein
MSKRISEVVTGPIFLTLVGLGFQFSDFHSDQVALLLFAIALAWLLVNVTPLHRRLPQLIVRRSMDEEQRDAEERSASLRDGIRRPSGPGDYRTALREVARLLYTSENLYAQSQGGHDVPTSSVWRDAAPREWGDALYERLGLPPEREYR